MKNILFTVLLFFFEIFIAMTCLIPLIRILMYYSIEKFHISKPFQDLIRDVIEQQALIVEKI